MGEGAAAAVAVCVFWGGGGGHLGFVGLGGGDNGVLVCGEIWGGGAAIL